MRELLRAQRRRVRELVVADDLDETPIVAEILDLAEASRVPVTTLARRRLDALAVSEAPQGVLARTSPLEAVGLEDLLAGPGVPFVLVADGITDPGNLGALLRVAECAGVSGVVLPRHRAVKITATVAKAAAGAIEHVRICVVGGIPSALGTLGDRGVWRLGLDGEASDSLYGVRIATEPLALVVGSEGRGVGRLAAERCDQLVSIPLAGALDSLNAASAVAVACFEIVRRRAEAG